MKATSTELVKLYQATTQNSALTASDDIFENGLDSLLATQLAERLSQHFHQNITPDIIFSHPSAQQLSDYLSQQLAMTFPLTDTQRAYWMLRQQQNSEGFHNNHTYDEIAVAAFDLARFQNAWARLIEHHSALRLSVNCEGQQHIQTAKALPPVTINDLQEATPETIDSALADCRATMTETTLNCQESLHQVVVNLLPENNAMIHLKLDLMAFDLTSLITLTHQLKTLYDNPKASLETPSHTFEQFISEQQTHPSRQKDQEYWHARLNTLPFAPNLPKTFHQDTPSFQRYHHSFTQEQTQQLKQLSKRHGLTLSSCLLTAYAKILAYWSNQSHFCLNIPITQRDARYLLTLGNFTSTLLCEIQLDNALSFHNQAQNIQKQLLQDFRHRRYSSVNLNRALSQDTINLSNPFDIVFTSGLNLGPIDMDTIGQHHYGMSQTAGVTLDCQWFETAEGLMLHWDVLTGHYAADILDHMFNAYCQLVSTLTHNDWKQPLQMSLPRAQQHARTPHSNIACTPQCLHQDFLRHVAEQPEAIAVIIGDEHVSYQQLYHYASRITHELQQLHIHENPRVAITLHPGWQQVASVLAVHMTGAAYIPVHFSIPDSRRYFVYEHTKAAAIINDQRCETELDFPADVPRITVETAAQNTAISQHPDIDVSPDAIAYMIFTSGTTGEPKGVVMTHAAAHNTIHTINQRFNVSAQDKGLALSQLSFDLSVYDMFGLLAAGGTIVYPNTGCQYDAIHWCQLIEAHQITLWNSVPALLEMCLTNKPNLPSLRLGLISGERIDLNLPQKWRKATPNGQFISLGGATEGGIWSIFYEVETVDPNWHSIPYGKALPNQAVAVLNHDYQPCPDYTEGEIFLMGDSLAQGYYEREDLTQMRFFTLANGQRAYATGDLGRYLPDGNIDILGRKDHQVKIYGQRVELGEVEGCLELHPDVISAIATCYTRPNGGIDLVGYVVLKDQPEQLTEQLTALPAFNEVFQALTTYTAPQSPGKAPHEETITTLVTTTIAQALQSLGCFPTANRAYTLEDIQIQGHIAPHYQRWLKRALTALTAVGILQHHEQAFTLIDWPRPLNTQAWQQARQQAKQAIGSDAAIAFAERSAATLCDTLQGQFHAAGNLFADDAMALAKALYIESFDDCNNVVRDTVEAFVKGRSNQDTIQLLEVGAGTGATTDKVLSALEQIDYHYTFTDVSPYFEKQLTEHYRNHNLDFQRFDLNEAAEAQGFSCHQYDIVIAASTLHVAKDIQHAMKSMNRLLKPGGIALLIEETHFMPLFHLTMGLQSGFDDFVERPKPTLHPLLTEAQWQQSATDAGFAAFKQCLPTDTASYAQGIRVLAMQTSETCEYVNVTKLQEMAKQNLPKQMQPKAVIQIDEVPLSDNGKIDRNALPKPNFQQSQTPYVAPRNPIEQDLAELWQQHLSLKRVGIHDNFLALGGDSLLATKIIADFNQRHPNHLSIACFLENPTIAGLCQQNNDSLVH